MELKLVTDRAEALALAGLVQRCAEASTAEFRDGPLPPDVGRRAIEHGFDQPEFLFLLARDDGAPDGVAGLCLAMPFVDPLTAERVPMIVLLHVEPSLRHRGVARALVSEAQRVLARRGQNTLAARAGHNDDALISMGERWGFLRAWELLVREQ
jgi:GNAT superfamily N-acetyltransferase